MAKPHVWWGPALRYFYCSCEQSCACPAAVTHLKGHWGLYSCERTKIPVNWPHYRIFFTLDASLKDDVQCLARCGEILTSSRPLLYVQFCLLNQIMVRWGWLIGLVCFWMGLKKQQNKTTPPWSESFLSFPVTLVHSGDVHLSNIYWKTWPAGLFKYLLFKVQLLVTFVQLPII